MAYAVVACLRYMFGIPFYRLAKIQGKMGIALPEGTQYQMVQQVYESCLPIYIELLSQAANASLIMADDTLSQELQGSGIILEVSSAYDIDSFFAVPMC